MWNVDPRARLCAEILGETLYPRAEGSKILIPINYEDITPDVLMLAQEAVFSFTPAHNRQVLPFVLYALEQNRSDLLITGYFDAYFLHMCHDFSLPISLERLPVGGELKSRYSSRYHQNWIAPSLSAMNRFEHGWAFEWAVGLLRDEESEIMFQFGEDLTMLCRILAMALGKPENEAPSFESK